MKGYTCPCGKAHTFALWVYAYWGVEIIHRCGSCGRENKLRRGILLNPGRKGKKT